MVDELVRRYLQMAHADSTPGSEYVYAFGMVHGIVDPTNGDDSDAERLAQVRAVIAAVRTVIDERPARR